MSGVSIGTRFQAQVPITLEADQYSIGHQPGFDRMLPDETLRLWVYDDRSDSGVQKIFADLFEAVINKRDVKLDEPLCNQKLAELAAIGQQAYTQLFATDEAFDALTAWLDIARQSGHLPAPTFVSERSFFPWELLYEGDDPQIPEPGKFWGLRYAPARILNPRCKDAWKPSEQSGPSNMLFCVHEGLRIAHDKELPEIKRRLQLAPNSFAVLNAEVAAGVADGQDLLLFLFGAPHNMVHFACHCALRPNNDDVLQVSILKDTDSKAVELGAFTFRLERVRGHAFTGRRPLVFLNACQSGGSIGHAHRILTLPKSFVEKGAAAVIATACPVPDLFAAKFAAHFYDTFMKRERPVPIGEALTETRRYFVEECHNPLALAYGLYTPAHYYLAQAPAAGGMIP